MTSFALRLSQVNDACRHLVGGKALSVAKLASNNLMTPKSLCITTMAFDVFIENKGLRDKIFMEYNRKQFNDMRWEEIWDLALRIKNMFLKTPFPCELANALTPLITNSFQNSPVVVRSSAIGEDSAKFSFAGIHESYVNIRGVDSILKHIKLVWASLFSDAAILYRQQTGLDVISSKMGVLIQQFINGQKSGVAFGKSPNSNSNMMIEAVYGLNQGLVDGTVEPDRWVLRRNNGRIISYTPAIKNKIVMAEDKGIIISKISESMVNKVPLTNTDIHRVYVLCKEVERIFGAAQDTEWTFFKRTLYCLQSRPITTKVFEDKDSKRLWYLSLRRSLADLKQLRKEIEQTLIPEMKYAAELMEKLKPSLLDDSQLANELASRKKIFDRWRAIYWDKFIPFAHGIRLFGEIYNQQIEPEDPYEFTRLLVATNMQSLERNRLLEKLAKIYASRQRMPKRKLQVIKDNDENFDQMLDQFIEKFRNPIWGLDSDEKHRKLIVKLLKQMSKPDYKKPSVLSRNYNKLENHFIQSFPAGEKTHAIELLQLARVSYQLRDDDNIYLGKIEGQFSSALNESKKRLNNRLEFDLKSLDAEEAILALKDPSYIPVTQKQDELKDQHFKIRPRQLTGQPAGAGLAIGKARVIKSPEDLFDFKRGEILVCDAIDPNMTFVVPIAAGIVERRGGMLIHGAIIAREYGLPCITGVPDVIDLIQNGQKIIVDGYLGIVTIDQGRFLGK